jgi:hypothetical protein
MPPALKIRNLWLGRALDKVALSGGKVGIWAAALLFVVMLCFARPVFHVDIHAMNSLSEETLAADRTFRAVWGDLTSRVYLMTEGRSLQELQAKSDRLTGMLKEDAKRGKIDVGFALSDLFPGEDLARRHAGVWQTSNGN